MTSRLEDDRDPKRPRLTVPAPPAPETPESLTRRRIRAAKANCMALQPSELPALNPKCEVTLRLLALSAAVPREMVATSQLLIPSGFEATRSTENGMITRLIEDGKVLPPHAATHIFAIQELGPRDASAFVAFPDSFLFIPVSQEEGDDLYTRTTQIKMLSRKRQRDTLDQSYLTAIVNHGLQGSDVPQFCVEALKTCRIAFSLSPPPSWLGPLEAVLTDENATLESIRDAQGLERLPDSAQTTLALLLARKLSSATLETIERYAWTMPLSTRASMLANLGRHLQLMAVTGKSRLSVNKAGAALGSKLLSECQEDEIVLCTPKPMAFNQMRCFSRADPRVYVLPTADTVVYRPGGGKAGTYTAMTTRSEIAGHYKTLFRILGKETEQPDTPEVSDEASATVIEEDMPALELPDDLLI